MAYAATVIFPESGMLIRYKLGVKSLTLPLGTPIQSFTFLYPIHCFRLLISLSLSCELDTLEHFRRTATRDRRDERDGPNAVRTQFVHVVPFLHISPATRHCARP
jgi:hypothetical protein